MLDILVTHYNEDSFVVNRFLDSLNSQTYKDLQVTIVDDGLECIPIEFNTSYSFKVNHLKFPHKTVSKARNNALDNSYAKYLMFCDCDDMFDSRNPTGLQKAMCRILTNDLDVYRTSHYFEEWKSNSGKPLSALYSDDEDADEIILELRNGINPSTVHSKIYKRDFIIQSGIRFLDKLYMNEDGAFNYLAKQICDIKNGKAFDDCENFYIWKYNKNSATRTNSIYPISGYDQYIKVTSFVNKRCLDELKKLNKPIDIGDCILQFVFQGYYWLYLYSDKFIGKENFNECLKADLAELKNFICEFNDYINFDKLEKPCNKNYVNAYMSKLDKCYVENKLDFKKWFIQFTK